MRILTLIQVAAAAFLSLACLPATASSAASYQVGLAELQLADPQGLRPLHVHVLYPAAPGGEAILLRDTWAQQGLEAVPDARRAAGRFPLVLISHGLYGRWTNYGWLAAALVAEGMIVALPTHPGTAWTDKESPETAKLWRRPQDLSRIIDHLTAAPGWREAVDADHIAAIGHSLGGFTVMAAAGARFDTARYRRYCAAHPQRGDCRWYAAAGVERVAGAAAKLESIAADPRVTAVVSYDLGFTQAFDPASVAAIDIPVLVIGAGNHQAELPVAAESRRLAEMLPPATSDYHEIADISHFSIFPLCKPGAVERLEAIGEGDEVICLDGRAGGRGRVALHAELLRLVKGFLRGAGFALAGKGG